jgi:hypothetical protein
MADERLFTKANTLSFPLNQAAFRRCKPLVGGGMTPF